MIKNIRQLENMHIFFWLLKDICWMMEFKTGGLAIAVPTLTMAVYLTVITFPRKDHFYPNLAVLCWISANIAWMVGEFFLLPFRPFALSLFVAGLIVIAYYFIKFYKAPGSPAAQRPRNGNDFIS